MLRKIIIGILLALFTVPTMAQFTYGTTGLLHMPTADMQRDKTVMLGGGYLDDHAMPSRWTYNTWNYYLNITFFPWLEMAYTCNVFNEMIKRGDKRLHMINQDRNFSARWRLWKEGWWKEWTPQIVIGLNDPTSGSWEGGSSSNDHRYNGFFCRYYIAATKHFGFKGIGDLGVHAAYVYNERIDYHLNGPCLGANFQLNLPTDNFWKKAANGLNMMAEYDSRTINVGASYSIWQDHINIIAELTECKYFSGGIFFKVHLK